MPGCRSGGSRQTGTEQETGRQIVFTGWGRYWGCRDRMEKHGERGCGVRELSRNDARDERCEGGLGVWRPVLAQQEIELPLEDRRIPRGERREELGKNVAAIELRIKVLFSELTKFVEACLVRKMVHGLGGAYRTTGVGLSMAGLCRLQCRLAARA